MTTPALPSMSEVTAVLMHDGQWHQVTPGTLVLQHDPPFLAPDGVTIVTMGGPWLGFTDAASGASIAFPFNQDIAVQWAAPPPGP